ncbi:MAG: BT_3987 domain-containing protein [Fermentimonas sp.]
MKTRNHNKGLGLALSMLLLLTFTTCDRDEVFEREQYKNVFALISESDNVSRKYHELGEESIGYVSASLGGTNPTTKDIVVTLVEDPSLLDDFNRTNYDTDVSKYGKPLPKDKYDIDNFKFTIPAGEINGRLPIRIRPDGLSPDTAYFISLRVESHSSYEVNPDKSYILYRVRTKNFWADASGNTNYSMRAKLRISGSTSELEMPGTKVMHPLTKNSVRVMAGNETYESNTNVFNRFAIVLKVDDNNKVSILPYGSIEVTQVDGDSEFTNTFFIEDDGFKTYKTFLLRYNYKSGNTIYEMKEELRMEFDPDEEQHE